MGNTSCCLGRINYYTKRLEDFEDKVIDNIASYEAVSDVLGLNEAKCDYTRFTAAYENDDFEEFVKLCQSKAPLEKLEKRLHPWAATPTTIGALAATQLAMYANKGSKPQYKDEIREVGGVKVLVEMLKEEDEASVHAAVVALAFLSVANMDNCVEMFNAGALPELVRGMKSQIDGMRAACAQTCRNIYQLDVEYRREFMKLGGLVNLVGLLEYKCEGTQFEAICHLEDFVMDGVDELPEFVSFVKATGALIHLRALEKGDNKELAAAAKDVAVRLVD